METNNFLPISIWDHNSGCFFYSVEVEHDKVNSEDVAYQKANSDFDKFGIFINKDSLPKRTLMFGAILKDGTFTHIPKGKVTIKIMNPQAAERLAPPNY